MTDILWVFEWTPKKSTGQKDNEILPESLNNDTVVKWDKERHRQGRDWRERYEDE